LLVVVLLLLGEVTIENVFCALVDILGVSPSSGSVEGGTRIIVTMNHSLVGYTEDIVVKVGGQ